MVNHLVLIDSLDRDILTFRLRKLVENSMQLQLARTLETDYKGTELLEISFDNKRNTNFNKATKSRFQRVRVTMT